MMMMAARVLSAQLAVLATHTAARTVPSSTGLVATPIGMMDGSNYASTDPAHVRFEPTDGGGDAIAHYLKGVGGCLDGSDPLYYWRPGNGSGKNKWYIHHQGGGWCGSPENCYGRAQMSLGSTNPAVSGDKNTSNLQGGYFSTDPSSNPLMYNWNSVFLRYCDGGSFSGNNESATIVNGKKVWFQGRKVLNAMIDDLVFQGPMKEATDVVISGCSAGGLATYLHIDHWAEALKSVSPNVKVRGLPDSGFFLDDPMKNYHVIMTWVFNYMNSTSGVNDACIAANGGQESKCIFAEHTAPYIKTPIFPLQGEYDSWQMMGDLDVNASDPKNYPIINDWGRNLTTLIHTNVLANAANGVFLDSCLHHCGGWGNYEIDGMVQGPAFQKWYNTGSGTYIQGQPYPCQKCCFPSRV